MGKMNTLETAADKMPGTIQSFRTEDHAGTILLDDARSVEFGRSACVGFEPFPALRVGVRRVLRDASGAWAAQEVTLDAHPMKDVVTAAPVTSPTAATSPFAVDVARPHFGWFTLLFETPLPRDREALRARFEVASLGRVRVHEGPPRDPMVPSTRELEILTAGQHLLALELSGPPAREGLDLRQVPADFELGAYRLGVAVGVVDPLRLRLAEPDTFTDPWAADGQMRVASLLARRLLAEGGLGIVLHLAGNLVLSRADFLRRLSEIDNPECKPFGAWVDWVLSPDRTRYRSIGMHAFGAMDVEIEILNIHAEVELDSAESGVLYACMLQARENRLLHPDEVFYVPKDIRVGPFGASAKERSGYKYTVTYQGETVLLVRD